MSKTRLRRAWLIAGLSLVGALAGGNSQAWANGGISVGLGVGKGGDPFFVYDVYVFLDPNQSLPIATLAHPFSLDLTLTSVTGLAAGVDATQVLYQFPPLATGITNWTPIIATNELQLKEQNTLAVVGPYSTTAETLLYELQITTPDSPNQKGLAPGDIVNYSYTIAGQPTQTGTITVFSIPEPSTIVMAAMGVAALPLVVIRQRRRRTRRVA